MPFVQTGPKSGTFFPPFTRDWLSGIGNRIWAVLLTTDFATALCNNSPEGLTESKNLFVLDRVDNTVRSKAFWCSFLKGYWTFDAISLWCRHETCMSSNQVIYLLLTHQCTAPNSMMFLNSFLGYKLAKYFYDFCKINLDVRAITLFIADLI